MARWSAELSAQTAVLPESAVMTKSASLVQISERNNERNNGIISCFEHNPKNAIIGRINEPVDIIT